MKSLDNKVGSDATRKSAEERTNRENANMHQLARLNVGMGCVLVVMMPKSLGLFPVSMARTVNPDSRHSRCYRCCWEDVSTSTWKQQEEYTYLMVINPTPQSKPSKMNNFQKAPLFARAHPVISFLCESGAGLIWDSSGRPCSERERREEVSSGWAS